MVFAITPSSEVKKWSLLKIIGYRISTAAANIIAMGRNWLAKERKGENKNFLAGLNVHKGQVTYKAVADVFGYEYVNPSSII